MNERIDEAIRIASRRMKECLVVCFALEPGSCAPVHEPLVPWPAPTADPRPPVASTLERNYSHYPARGDIPPRRSEVMAALAGSGASPRAGGSLAEGTLGLGRRRKGPLFR